jgi:cytochrome c-type biogenesis protein CcmH
MKLLAIAVMALTLLTGAAQAVEPNEMLSDPALEARARQISAGLRCLVCQNQSIDDSNAEIAHDLRVLVRERLSAGDTDEEVVGYVVARYGEFVLLTPPFDSRTLILWLLAPALIVIGGAALWMGRRRRAAASLAEDEQREIDRILRENKDV